MMILNVCLRICSPKTPLSLCTRCGPHRLSKLELEQLGYTEQKADLLPHLLRYSILFRFMLWNIVMHAGSHERTNTVS